MYGFFTLTIFASKSGVTTPSKVPNILPKPSVINIMKNKIAQTCGAGIWMIASVKAMNVNPAPDAT